MATKGLKVIIIGPHSSTILDKSQFVYYKEAVSSLHDITLVLYLGKEAVRDSRVQKIKLS